MTALLESAREAAPGDFRFGPRDAGEVPFLLLGEAYAIDVPADGRTACAWAREGAWPRLVPWGLAEWCRGAFFGVLLDPVGRVDLTVCHRIVLDLAGQIYGVPWWTAGRVAMAASENWDKYAAWCVRRGFDPAGESAHRIIASGLGWLREGVQEEKDAQRLETQLFAPPRPVRRGRSRAAVMPGFSAAEQSAAFHAAQAALGSGSG